LYLLGRTYQQTGRVDEAQRLIARAVRLSPRLERWADSEIPNILRVRAQFDATSLRMQGGITLWNPPRLARKAAANRALNALKEPQP